MKDNMTRIGHDSTALSKPPTVPLKNSSFGAQMVLFTDNLKADTIWKIQETIEAAHKLSYAVETYTEEIEKD